MCGIAGLAASAGAPPPARAALAAMATALAHRGPDGVAIDEGGPIGLAQTRLAIIDIPGADQPFIAGNVRLIANGEIYNYRQLRAALPGAPFGSHGDCEPPLFLWQRDGDAFTQQLRGMYAIAIAADRRLVLSRDPFGIKPLYYAETDAGFAFASEPRALPVARRVRPEAVHALLQHQFVAGAETALAGIHRMLPGETLLIDNGAIAGRHRLPALPDGTPETITEADALTRFDAALMDSVAAHLQSDVPYGMFLSGGLDSSAVLACMARIDRQPLAFTAGFDAAGAADEREAAATVARAVGARHETILITHQDVWQHLPAIVASMDDPAADYAIIPTWLLARRARADVKVVLSGEGGDELLAGYGRYRRAMRPRWRGGRPMRHRGAFDGMGVLRDTNFVAAPSPPRGAGTRLAAAQAEDCADWLPHDLLLKLDRCLMAHGIEGRTPFLDPVVAAATFLLPDRLKVRHGQGKYLLRQWLSRALPEARPFARKQGFTVPIGHWIAADPHLGSLVAAQPCIAAIAHPDAVRTVFARASRGREAMAAWRLLFYALWHRTVVEGAPADADVWSALRENT